MILQVCFDLHMVSRSHTSRCIFGSQRHHYCKHDKQKGSSIVIKRLKYIISQFLSSCSASSPSMPQEDPLFLWKWKIFTQTTLCTVEHDFEEVEKVTDAPLLVDNMKKRGPSEVPCSGWGTEPLWSVCRADVLVPGRQDREVTEHDSGFYTRKLWRNWTKQKQYKNEAKYNLNIYFFVMEWLRSMSFTKFECDRGWRSIWWNRHEVSEMESNEKIMQLCS